MKKPKLASKTVTVAPQGLVNAKVAAKMLEVKEQTLALWRHNKQVPLNYFRVNGRFIRYDVAEIERFRAARIVAVTVPA